MCMSVCLFFYLYCLPQTQASNSLMVNLLVAILTTPMKRKPFCFNILVAPTDAKYESAQTTQS